MTLRSDIHAALDEVTPSAPHLPSMVVDAVVRSTTPSGTRRLLVVLVAAAAAWALLVGAGLVALISLGPQAKPPSTPASGPPATLVFTTWVADPSVTGGPYPGYRPHMTRMTPDMVTRASADRDPNGGSGWVVSVTLNAEGRRIFGDITSTAYRACGSDGTGTCPESRVAIWLDLTQEDIDAWSTQGDDLYKKVDNGGKLLSDPYILAPITGGELYIQGELSRESATRLAHEIKP